MKKTTMPMIFSLETSNRWINGLKNCRNNETARAMYNKARETYYQDVVIITIKIWDCNYNSSMGRL